MRRFIKLGPSIVTVISALTVLVSILHEWAYYKYMEINLFGIMSMSDFATTALQWLPATLLAFFAGMMLDLLSTRIEGGLSEEELVAQSPYPRFTYWFRRSADASIPVLLMLAGVGGFLFLSGAPVWPIGVSIAVAWRMFSVWTLKNDKISEKFTTFSARAFVFTPAIAVIILMIGASSANSDLQSSTGDFNITVKNHEIFDEVQILRALSSGLLIRSPSRERIAFLPWSEVKKVSRRSIELNEQQRICLWFENSCPKLESKSHKATGVN